MRAMRNLRQRGKSGVWYVVMDIPPEARPSFEGRLSMARETFIQIWTEMDKANRVRFAQAMRVDRRRFEALPGAQVTTALQASLSEHQPLLLSGLRDRSLTSRGIEGQDASEVC